MLEQGTRNPEFGADKFGFRDLTGVNWNFVEPELYECALNHCEAQLTSGGALCAETGDVQKLSPITPFHAATGRETRPPIRGASAARRPRRCTGRRS